jgi:hypothetical protein
VSVYGETPGGSVNGSNTVFTTAHPYVTASTRVFINGDRKHLSVDYTESATSQITFASAPASMSVILVDYDNEPPDDTWTPVTVDGVDMVEISTARFRVPVAWDPTSRMFIAFADPGSSLGNFPAIAKGDPGDSAALDTTVPLTMLDATDPTADSASLTALSPTLWQLGLVLHKAAKGDTGTTTLDPTAYGTPVSKQILIVNPTADGFIYQTQEVGDRYFPASVSPVPSGYADYTLGTVSIPAQDFDWRPQVRGSVVVTGTGTDVAVDLIARLGDETAGNEIGRGFGLPGLNPPPHVLIAGPPPGAGADSDRVLAGVGPTIIYLRTEKQSGADYYTTTAAQTRFSVKVDPIP